MKIFISFDDQHWETDLEAHIICTCLAREINHDLKEIAAMTSGLLASDFEAKDDVDELLGRTYLFLDDKIRMLEVSIDNLREHQRVIRLLQELVRREDV